MLCPLSLFARKRKSGTSTPFVIGENRRYKMRYFFARQFCTVLFRVHSSMVACSGQPQGWPVPIPGVENPLHVAANLFSTVCGGLYPTVLELTAMKSHAINPTTSDLFTSEHPTTNQDAYQQSLTAAQAQLSKLADTYALFFSDIENFPPAVIDCSLVTEEAEKLIEEMLTLKKALIAHRSTMQTSAADQPVPGNKAPTENHPHAHQADKNSFNINPPRRVSVTDLMPTQAEQRGLEPLPLEPELLLKRIKDGGHSGTFLADAFISAYRTDQPFKHSLGELIKLDAEAFRLFHQCLHIRSVRGWNDDNLYQLEQQVKTIMMSSAVKGGKS